MEGKAYQWMKNFIFAQFVEIVKTKKERIKMATTKEKEIILTNEEKAALAESAV